MNPVVVSVMQYTTIAMELASFITGLIYWYKIKNSNWVWFVIYLGFIVAGEILCNVLSYTVYINKVNTIFNYIIIPVEFLFFYWLYYKHVPGNKNKLLVIVCCLLYLLSLAADQYFFQGKQFLFDSLSYCAGNLLLLVVILAFFLAFSKGNEILDYRSSLLFWISLGNLVFYLGTLPFFGLIHLLYEKHRVIFNYYTYLMFLLDWVMYLLFIIGFVKWKPK